MSEALASGALTPVVGQELPLADAAEAHRRVMAPGARGKIVADGLDRAVATLAGRLHWPDLASSSSMTLSKTPIGWAPVTTRPLM